MRKRVRIWHSRCLLRLGVTLACASVLLLILKSSQEKSLFSTPAVGSQPVAMMRAAPSATQLIISSHKPFILYGTAWKKDATAALVQKAVTAGFRFIDTACQPKHYNEKGVGVGWTSAASELGLQRSDMFLQTKYTPYRGQDPRNVPYDETASLEEQVQQSLKVSLSNLQTEYLDSMVLHSPLPTFEETIRVWRTMEGFVDQGLVKRLGISNCYELPVFSRLYEEARIKPSVLQNRFYSDSNFDTELRQFVKAHSIWYQSFWTLSANREALALPEVKEFAQSKNLTPQTLMYAFIMSWGYGTPLSGTTSEQHMKEDVDVMTRLQNGETIFETDSELQHFTQLLGMPQM